MSNLNAVGKDWTFDGLLGNYIIFIIAHRNDMNHEKISYLLQDSLKEDLADIPLPRRSRLRNRNDAAHADRAARADYNNQLVEQRKLKKQVELDFTKAISLVHSRLSPAIQGNIEVFDRDTSRSPQQKYEDIMEYIRTNHGNNPTGEAKILKEKMEAATDSIGYKALLDLYDRYQSYLDMIPLIGDDGLPIQDGQGNALTHKLSSAEMRYLLVKRLGTNGNAAMFQLKQEMNRKPTMTYEEARVEINNLISNDPTAFSTMSSISSASSINTSPAMIMVNSSTTTTNHEVGNTFPNNTNSTRPSYCVNCKASGHRAYQCPSTTCYTCNLNFPSSELRQAHAKQVHSRRRQQMGMTIGASNTQPLQIQQQPMSMPPPPSTNYSFAGQSFSPPDPLYPMTSYSGDINNRKRPPNYMDQQPDNNKRAAVAFNANVIAPLSVNHPQQDYVPLLYPTNPYYQTSATQPSAGPPTNTISNSSTSTNNPTANI